MEAERLWRLAEMSPEQLDVLPFGAIVVDFEGNVASYNQYEAALSHLDAERVVGKNFFHDIAPCTAVQAFQGKMREFVRSKERVSEAFDYFFPFAHGATDVSITFVKLPDRKSILIAIEKVEKR
jgi:photoactive yellow protein